MATDRDIGPNAMLFYYITAGNQDLTFRMDRVTGEMVTRPAPPDRERQQEYRLTVTVEDDGTPPLSVRYKEHQLQQVEHFKIYLNMSDKKLISFGGFGIPTYSGALFWSETYNNT